MTSYVLTLFFFQDSTMNNIQEPEAVVSKAEEQCKVYGIRWAMLSIFVMYSSSNAMQWIQYSIVAEVIVKFYGISYAMVDMTSMIYMILYIPFIFPGSYLLDKLVGKRFHFKAEDRKLFEPTLYA